jgi:xanthosine utilization system XapX-like protein
MGLIFIYIGKEVIPIARILKKFNIKVAFKTRNTLEKWLGCKQLYPEGEKI